MVSAWYMDEVTTDQRLPHKTDPPQMVDLEELKQKTGVMYWKIEGVNDYLNDPTLNKLKKDRGYTYEDELNITHGMPGYEEKIKVYFEEHIHIDEEIRLVLDGSGYFDARDVNDRWIRIEVTKGDLIILPAGIYHRFTLDKKDYIHAKRYFVGEPVWTAHPRSDTETESLPSRVGYVKSMGGK